MKTESDLRERLEKAVAEYESARNALPAPAVAEISSRIKCLKQELSDMLVSGANPCPDCGSLPHGMRHEGIALGIVVYVYEIGCLKCRDHRARGSSQEAAVAAWNQGKWVAAAKPWTEAS